MQLSPLPSSGMQPSKTTLPCIDTGTPGMSHSYVNKSLLASSGSGCGNNLTYRTDKEKNTILLYVSRPTATACMRPALSGANEKSLNAFQSQDFTKQQKTDCVNAKAASLALGEHSVRNPRRLYQLPFHIFIKGLYQNAWNEEHLGPLKGKIVQITLHMPVRTYRKTTFPLQD